MLHNMFKGSVAHGNGGVYLKRPCNAGKKAAPKRAFFFWAMNPAVLTLGHGAR